MLNFKNINVSNEFINIIKKKDRGAAKELIRLLSNFSINLKSKKIYELINIMNKRSVIIIFSYWQKSLEDFEISNKDDDKLILKLYKKLGVVSLLEKSLIYNTDVTEMIELLIDNVVDGSFDKFKKNFPIQGNGDFYENLISDCLSSYRLHDIALIELENLIKEFVQVRKTINYVKLVREIGMDCILFENKRIQILGIQILNDLVKANKY